MEHKVWYDEDNELLRVGVIGIYHTQDAVEVGKLAEEILDGKPHRQIIVDLSEAIRLESRETRKVQGDILKDIAVTGVAYVGAAAAVRMIAKVMMKLGHVDTATDFFKTDEEALSWLKNQRRS